MAVEVRLAGGDADLETCSRIDLNAFGLPFDQREFERTLEWRRTTTSYLAELDGEPAGSCLVHDLRMTVPGGATVGMSGVGDVGVQLGKRRRGVLAAMMERMLGDGVERGHVAAGLYASEATIYERFGFGPATRSKNVTIESSRAALRPDVPVADGEIVVLAPEERLDALPEVYRRARLRRGGEVDRSEQAWRRALSSAAGEPERRLCMALRNPGGALDAYVLYRIDPRWDATGPGHRLEVLELVALDDPSELALWQALTSHDLVHSVKAWVASDSMLFDALQDGWALSTIGEHDTLWLRLLDVRAALGARRYRVPGHLVFEVSQEPGDGTPSERTAGVWEMVVDEEGSAELGPSTSEPELCVGAGALASAWLGGGSFARLGAVGRVQERVAGAASRADALFGWWPSPRITHQF